jgi:hypothetical protein
MQTAARPQAARRRPVWASKTWAAGLAAMVLGGYISSVILDLPDSPKTHSGCCGGIDCSLPCLNDLPIDVGAAQELTDYVTNHSYIGKLFNKATDLVDFSEACVVAPGKGRELRTYKNPYKPLSARRP